MIHDVNFLSRAAHNQLLSADWNLIKYLPSVELLPVTKQPKNIRQIFFQ